MGKIALATLAGQKVYLDTNAFIYAFERHVDYAVILDLLLSSIDAGVMSSLTSEITLAECLVKPFADGNSNLQDRYQAALTNRPGFTVAPISRQILIQAAKTSRTLQIPPPRRHPPRHRSRTLLPHLSHQRQTRRPNPRNQHRSTL
jgi:predicted nucleic acid-binding protein